MWVSVLHRQWKCSCCSSVVILVCWKNHSHFVVYSVLVVLVTFRTTEFNETCFRKRSNCNFSSINKNREMGSMVIFTKFTCIANLLSFVF
jgi:hypothetical protein